MDTLCAGQLPAQAMTPDRARLEAIKVELALPFSFVRVSDNRWLAKGFEEALSALRTERHVKGCLSTVAARSILSRFEEDGE